MSTTDEIKQQSKAEVELEEARRELKEAKRELKAFRKGELKAFGEDRQWLVELKRKLRKEGKLTKDEKREKKKLERKEERLEQKEESLEAEKKKWSDQVALLQERLNAPVQPVLPFQDRYIYLSTPKLAYEIMKDPSYQMIGADLSFLETLDTREEGSVGEIFSHLDPPNLNWTNEIKDIQPWIQKVYQLLADLYDLTVQRDARFGGPLGSKYADHYLTYPELSQYCNSKRIKIDYTKNWAFEDKSDWSSTCINKAIVQCYTYSKEFFEEPMNRTCKYVSIMTDSRQYRLWYAFWNGEQNQMNVKATTDYQWGLETLKILARVFKTFSTIGLRASASPRNFGNMGSTKDISNSISTALDNPFAILFDRRARTQVFYELILESSIDSPSGLPFVRTADGDIQATRLLGTGSDSVVFEARTASNERVAIKLGLTSDILKREVQMLKILKEVKNIPKLLYEELKTISPYIVTSMVGREISNVGLVTACNIIADILIVLKDLHTYGYIHNDIHPGNIVNVDGKYRLIDFGLAVPRSNERDNVPSDWPQGNIIFASHNGGKYLGAGDDLEALCYTVAFMYNRNKEYWHVVAKDPCKANHQKERKLVYLFDGLPPVFRDFFDYVYDLDIAATPVYDYWQGLFLETAETLRSRPRKHLPETSLGSLDSERCTRPRIEQQAW